MYATRVRTDSKERSWTHQELMKATNNLKVGSVVEVRINFGLDDEKNRGKLMKGEVIEKNSHHFLVRINAKRGQTWNESFKYIDLMPDAKGNVTVRVLKKGKK